MQHHYLWTCPGTRSNQEKKQRIQSTFFLEFTPHDQLRSNHALWGVVAIKTNERSIRGKAIFLWHQTACLVRPFCSSNPVLSSQCWRLMPCTLAGVFEAAEALLLVHLQGIRSGLCQDFHSVTEKTPPVVWYCIHLWGLDYSNSPATGFVDFITLQPYSIGISLIMSGGVI